MSVDKLGVTYDSGVTNRLHTNGFKVEIFKEASTLFELDGRPTGDGRIVGYIKNGRLNVEKQILNCLGTYGDRGTLEKVARIKH